MSHERAIRANVYSPEYWDGVDISKDCIGERGDLPRVSVGIRKYANAMKALEAAASSIYSGNVTEVKYSRKMDFDPQPQQLADGSVVIVDRETIARMAVDSPLSFDHDRPSIYRPFTDYWRENLGLLHLGVDAQILPKDYFGESVFYARELNWGVIDSDKSGGRYIQTFSFDNPTWRKNRFAISVDQYSHSGNPLPIEIGKVYTLNGDDADASVVAATRFRGIDVVYPAMGKRERGKKRKIFEKLGRISLHHPAPSLQ